MKKEEIYKEIGLIDDSLIEAAEHSGIEARKKRIPKKVDCFDRMSCSL